MLIQDPFHSLNPIEDLAKAGIESSSNLPGTNPLLDSWQRSTVQCGRHGRHIHTALVWGPSFVPYVLDELGQVSLTSVVSFGKWKQQHQSHQAAA